MSGCAYAICVVCLAVCARVSVVCLAVCTRVCVVSGCVCVLVGVCVACACWWVYVLCVRVGMRARACVCVYTLA